MPTDFSDFLEELTKLPPVPKYIPGFTITVSVEELQALKKIFTISPNLDKLILSYTKMHRNLKTLKPKFIKNELLEANTVLNRLFELLADKYVRTKKELNNEFRLADKWCDYIKKLIESNNKNITEIDAFLA